MLPKGPKHQKLPTLEEVASRRLQTVQQLLNEWGVSTDEHLVKRCELEGVDPGTFTFAKPKPAAKQTESKNALVDMSKPKADPPVKAKEEDVKKARSEKLTSDEPDRDAGRDDVDRRTPKGTGSDA